MISCCSSLKRGEVTVYMYPHITGRARKEDKKNISFTLISVTCTHVYLLTHTHTLTHSLNDDAYKLVYERYQSEVDHSSRTLDDRFMSL